MKKVLLALGLIVFSCILISYFRNVACEPEVMEIKNDFLFQTKAPKEIQSIIKKSCYDCHSYETVYPSYAKYFPISVIIDSHINEAREHANFSQWQDYNKESKTYILDKIIEQISQNRMPMASYRLIHADANLTIQQKEILLNWLKMQKEKI